MFTTSLSQSMMAAAVPSLADHRNESDIELGMMSPLAPWAPAMDLDLHELVRDRAVMDRLFETPVHRLDAHYTPRARPKKPTTKQRSYKKLWFCAPPLLAGVATGIVFAVTQVHINGYSACRAGVCASFGSPKWAILEGLAPTSGGTVYGSYQGLTSGNQTSTCLASFDDKAKSKSEAAMQGVVTTIYNKVLVGKADGTYVTTKPCGKSVGAVTTLRTQTWGWGIVTVAVAEILLWMCWPAKRPQKAIPWLDAHVRWLISPRLSAIKKDLRHMPRGERKALEQEIYLLLQNLLADRVARADKVGAEEILDLGVMPNGPLSLRQNALQTSLTHRTDDLTRLLLAHATSFSAIDLHVAAQATDITNLLTMMDKLKRHRGLTPADVQGLYARLAPDFLFALCASEASMASDFEALLTHLGPEVHRLIAATDDQLRTPLHIASFWHRPDKAEVLLAFGANPEARDAFGKKPADLFASGLAQSEQAAA